ncbi:DotU family type IV/VI secretion system protein [Pigmentibacter sp. JX0631]|uniref:DotU family type IV/VI secretion system protein n=1 Tax=Pigmentibacter sp. JX0631 TaxID=2976982 RepID=UPI00246922EB|nr:DotU family type IV/VI secretion system protein [Pigmentibacter sp. JX0631]WGL60335.1 DotU family type IV/VI secretion system protein [Pigmentibacter sp. JX0631]
MSMSVFQTKNIQFFEKFCFDLSLFEKKVDSKLQFFKEKSNSDLKEFYTELKEVWNDVYKNIVLFVSNNTSYDRINGKLYLEFQYAMIALSDEFFLKKNNEISDYWKDNTLEYIFYGTRSSGTIIFDKIDKIIRENDTLNSDLAYVYLLLLGLGFKGKYHINNEEDKIKYYQKELFRIINSKMNITEEKEFVLSNSLNIPKNIKDLFLPDIKKWYFYILITIFIYFVISSFIWLVFTNKSNEKIEKYNSILNELVK